MIRVKQKPSRLPSRRARRENLAGYLFAGPAILGFLLFAMLPIATSLFASFTDWNMLTPAKPVGLENYKNLLTADFYFWSAIKATFYYAVLSVVASNIIALAVALLLNTTVRLQGIYRSIYYLPTVVPAVAQALLWGWLFNVDYGLFNNILTGLGLQPCQWLAGPNTVIPSLVLMSVWGCGGAVVIYISGLQSVPVSLLESVSVEGGNAWDRFRTVTLPYMSPIIFFNVLMSIIGSLQVFTQAMMMTGGGPNGRSLFYSYYLYLKAFRDNEMGYACAMAWILFLIIAVVTVFFFRAFKDRLYYESDAA